MSKELSGLRVAFLTANEGVEQAELTAPWDAVQEAGGIPELLAPDAGKVQAYIHMDKAGTFDVHCAIGDANPLEYGALVVPGGVANADRLRTVQSAITFAQRMFDQGKPAAVICHGPWLLVDAGLVRGRTLTSWPSLATDIRNAGGIWVDTAVQVCSIGSNSLVTSRRPDDLRAFCGQLVETFAQLALPASWVRSPM